MKTVSPAEGVPSVIRRGLHFLKWLVPGVILALLPKCPACLAAYVAVSTGIGLSMPVAGHLRTLLIVACVISLCYLAIRQARRVLAPARIHQSTNHC